MKKLIVILVLLLPCVLLAQNKSKIDTLYVVDGEIAPGIKNLHPDSIWSVDVIKQKALAAVYDSKDAVVIVVTTKKAHASKRQPTDSSKLKIRGGEPNGPKPLYIVNGKRTADINKINPDDILSFDVIKPPKSIKLYGKRGINGVVLVTTKKIRRSKPKPAPADTSKIILRGDKYHGPKPLYIVDGKRVAHVKNINKINPNDIASVDIIKPPQSVKLYGKRAINGVILITTKKTIK